MTIQAYPLAWPEGWRQRNDGAIEIHLQPWAPPLVIDAIDAPVAMHLTWYAHRERRQIYARSDVYVYGKRKALLFHRVVMGAKPGQLVDHASGDGMDNRRCNLRFATHSQNSANRRAAVSRMYSDFRGVSVDKRSGKWIAQVGHGYRHINIGTFDEEVVAAAAYDIYAKALHGEFASTNLGVQMGYIQ